MPWAWPLVTSVGEAPILKLSVVWSTPSLPLLPSPLWPRVVVLVRVSSMGRIDLFEHYSYKIKILYIIWPCAKKFLGNKNSKNVYITVQCTLFSNLLTKYNPTSWHAVKINQSIIYLAQSCTRLYIPFENNLEYFLVSYCPTGSALRRCTCLLEHICISSLSVCLSLSNLIPFSFRKKNYLCLCNYLFET